MSPHLVILRDDHLGDMVLTTPLVRTLAAVGWRVTVVGPRAWAAVWLQNPHAHYQSLETICGEKKVHVWRLAKWLRTLAPTHILVPYHHPPLFWASALSGVSQRYSLMGRYWGRLTLHHCLRTHLISNPRHMGDVIQDFAEAVGVKRASPQPELFLSPEENTAMQATLAAKLPGAAPLIVVAPFHGGNTCHLSVDQWVEVVRRLQQGARCRVAITGVARERELWQEAARELPSKDLWVTCGELTLRELFALIAQASRMVCGGTGPLHIASGVGTPAVQILCARPEINHVVWGNLAAGTVTLSPELSQCLQKKQEGVANCHFCHGPTLEKIVEVVLKSISR